MTMATLARDWMPATQSNFDFDVLRSYQQEFLEFAEGLRHVFCGDEMGLGKTYEGVALDAVRRHQQATSDGAIKGTKTLVIAPLTGVVDSWVKHFRKLTNLTVRRVDNSSRDARLSFIGDINDPGVDVLVMHWECLQKRMGLLDALSEQTWLHVIADEAHRAKNRQAQQTKGLKDIRKVAFKTAMTGTPMKNRPDDAWSIIDWLYKGKPERIKMWPERRDEKLFSSYWNFFNEFIEFYEVQGFKYIQGTKNEKRFRSLIEPFYIRRTKDKVADLPEKFYSTRMVELGPKQRKPYDSMAKDMLAWLGTQGDQPLAATVVIAQLIRLQQMALAHCLVEEVVVHKEDEGAVWTEVSTKVTGLEKPSAKLDALVEVADEMAGKKLVVFSQFSKMIDLAAQELADKGYVVGKITGDTKHEERTRLIAEFQAQKEPGEGQPQIMLCTIGAGGTGIDLYQASTIVFLDRAWSPADNQQAEDRCHRIGQTEPVHIIDIVAKDTIDKSRGKKINLKASWIANMLSDLDESE